MTKIQRQLSYRYTESGDQRIVNVADSEHGVVAHLAAGPTPPERGQRKPPMGTGLSTSLAFVHPDFRRQGIATTMYNVLSHQLGYRPMQDAVRTPMGDKWAQSTGAPLPQRMPMKQWDIPAETAYETIPEKQSANWMRGEPIDPTVVKALTPYKEPRRRKKGPQYEQGVLDLGEGF
jgi:GNAT superfamily N-acetyltransferase